MMTRKFEYERAGLFWKGSSMMTRKLYFETSSLDYEKEVVLWERKF